MIFGADPDRKHRRISVGEFVSALVAVYFRFHCALPVYFDAFPIDGIQLNLFTASDRFGKRGERGFSVIWAMADYKEFFFCDTTWIHS